MKYTSHTCPTGVDDTGTSLRLLVNRLVCDSEIPTNPYKSIIANKVPADIQMTDKEKVGPVISELVNKVIANARNGNIHISAERFNDVVILEIQDRNNYNGYALGYSIQSIESQAVMLGGYIKLKGQQQLVATVSFSFPNA